MHLLYLLPFAEVESQVFVTDRTVHPHLQLSIIITTSVVVVSLLILSVIILTLLLVIYVVRRKNRQMTAELNHTDGAAKSDHRVNDLSSSTNGSGKELSMSLSIKQSPKHSNGNGQIKNGQYSIV